MLKVVENPQPSSFFFVWLVWESVLMSNPSGFQFEPSLDLTNQMTMTKMIQFGCKKHDGQHSQPRLLSFLVAKVYITNIIFLYRPLGGGVLWAQYIPTNAIYGIMAIWYFNCLAEYQEKRTHFNWNQITFFTSKM